MQYTGMNCMPLRPIAPLGERSKPGALRRQAGSVQGLRLSVARHEAGSAAAATEARLVVIGDGTFRAPLEQLNRELGVGADFLGELPQQTVRPWLERARVFCGPSVTLEDGMSEAFGNVFSESQAMGVPVVSFRHGGIPETMRDGITGLLAPERDVEQLAAHLTRYLEDNSFWAKSREEGMRWVGSSLTSACKRQSSKISTTASSGSFGLTAVRRPPRWRWMHKVLVFKETLLPASETFILAQMRALTKYVPIVAGLERAHPSLPLPQEPLLLSKHSPSISDVRAKLYRRTGIAPLFHHKAKRSSSRPCARSFCQWRTHSASLGAGAACAAVGHALWHRRNRSRSGA